MRSLSTTAKGIFRTVGGAATATPAKGTSTFITTDRCDGTVTEVGRGSVAVIAKKGGKRTTVRAGRAYIVRAKLFQRARAAASSAARSVRRTRALPAALAAPRCSPPPPAPPPRGERVGTFAEPVYVTGLPGRARTLAVVERYGRVRSCGAGRCCGARWWTSADGS